MPPAKATPTARFEARLQRPSETGADWGFLRLPQAASDLLPRRGRTTVEGRLNGAAFRATLEPDGQRGHWLRVDAALREAAGVDFGETVTVEMSPVDPEPDPALPPDFAAALQAHAAARAGWEATTTVARVDWIHWITSAKQASTRVKRIADACDMLADGKRRVCCFDPSGVYSKAFKPPRAADGS